VTLADALDDLTRLPGVRGALVVSTADGLVVADALMEDVDGGAVAALTASLLRRMRGVAHLLGQAAPQLLHLVGAEGSLLAAPAGEELLVVAVARPEVNVGAVRLALRRAAERVT
jgi:predicted regulator of Ras-like GTPase activity (Roadblock/LC7/MglB family)